MRITRSQLHNIIAETLEQDDIQLRKIKQKFNEEWIKNFFITACQKTILSGDGETSAYWAVMNFLAFVYGEFGRISPHIRKSLTNYCYGCLYSLDEAGVINITMHRNGIVYYYVLTDDTLSNLVDNFNLDEGYYKDDEAMKNKFFQELIISRLAEEPEYAHSFPETLWQVGRRWLKDSFDDEDPSTYRYINNALETLYLQQVIIKDADGMIRLADDYVESQVEDFNLDESSKNTP
jgi:hypothetical protein